MSLFSSILILMLNINISHAVLTAITANTIQGTAPNLKPDAAKYLGFNVGTRPVVFYNEINGKLKTTYFDSTLTFEDFIPQPLANTLYYDADGDIAKSTESIVSTPALPVMEWYDANGTPITASDYKKSIGCSEEFEEPFKLIITAKNVVVTSEYGDPDTNTIGDISNTYEIKVKPQICGYKTNDIIVNEAQQWIDTAGNWHGTNYSSSVVTTPEYSVSPYRG